MKLLKTYSNDAQHEPLLLFSDHLMKKKTFLMVKDFFRGQNKGYSKE